MSAWPCSNSLPWLEKGSSPFGLMTLTSVFFSTSFSRSAHSIARPSCSNSPSSWATSSGRPWNGAVVSKTSFFMDRALLAWLVACLAPAVEDYQISGGGDAGFLYRAGRCGLHGLREAHSIGSRNGWAGTLPHLPLQ